MTKKQLLNRPIQFRSAYGFTLIELMVVVAIVGILASVAYPSFMSQVQKSRRSDAVVALSAIQQAQERWRANNPTYASTIAALGITSPTSGTYYTLVITGTPTGATYIAMATAVSGKSQANDTACSTLTVRMGSKSDDTLTPGNSNFYPAECWSK